MTRVIVGLGKRVFLDSISPSFLQEVTTQRKTFFVFVFILQKEGIIVWKDMSVQHPAQCLLNSRCSTRKLTQLLSSLLGPGSAKVLWNFFLKPGLEMSVNFIMTSVLTRFLWCGLEHLAIKIILWDTSPVFKSCSDHCWMYIHLPFPKYIHSVK